MDSIDYLKKIESQGFEAYLVGGYVRDKILGRDSYDLDIATSAKPEEIKKIFDLSENDNYRSVKFHRDAYQIDITTFREDSEYLNRRPTKIKFAKTVLDDSKRRDFTINAIYMDSKGQYLDYVEGLADIKNKTIRSIGNPDVKFTEDPLRMLRGIRLTAIYNFKIEEQTYKSILKNKALLANLSYERRKEELSKILTNRYALNALKLLKELGLLEYLEIDFNQNYRFTSNYLGAWAQIDFTDSYPFTKREKEKIRQIKELICRTTINPMDIFKCGLDTVQIAAEIMDISKKTIDDINRKMPIHQERDLKIHNIDIVYLLNLKPSPIIKKIKYDLIIQILNGNLLNDKTEIIKYIKEKWSD